MWTLYTLILMNTHRLKVWVLIITNVIISKKYVIIIHRVMAISISMKILWKCLELLNIMHLLLIIINWNCCWNLLLWYKCCMLINYSWRVYNLWTKGIREREYNWISWALNICWIVNFLFHFIDKIYEINI